LPLIILILSFDLGWNYFLQDLKTTTTKNKYSECRYTNTVEQVVIQGGGVVTFFARVRASGVNRNKGTTVALEQLTLSSSDDSCCIATFLGNSHMLIAVSKTEICTYSAFCGYLFCQQNFYFFQLPILHKINWPNLSRPRFEALNFTGHGSTLPGSATCGWFLVFSCQRRGCMRLSPGRR